jgi:hypothetical protein
MVWLSRSASEGSSSIATRACSSATALAYGPSAAGGTSERHVSSVSHCSRPRPYRWRGTTPRCGSSACTSWPEYDEQVAFRTSRLVDIYWNAAPAWYKEDVVDHFRAARRWRLRREWWEARFVIAPVSALMLAVASFLLVMAVFSGERVNLLLFTVFYILEAILWRIMLFKPDASALKMLEILS